MRIPKPLIESVLEHYMYLVRNRPPSREVNEFVGLVQPALQQSLDLSVVSNNQKVFGTCTVVVARRF